MQKLQPLLIYNFTQHERFQNAPIIIFTFSLDFVTCSLVDRWPFCDM
jgi:hypothetical protein